MPKRFWRTYPATPTPMERRRSTRVFTTAILVAVALLTAAIVVLFVFVLNLKSQRDEATRERDAAIHDAFCSVIAEFHNNSGDLQRARADLHCPQQPFIP